jgi:uncharacterized protein YjiS (DUF1127 family)
MAPRCDDHAEIAGATTLTGRLARWLRRRPRGRGSLRDLDPHVLRDLGLDRPQVAVRRARS